MSNLTRMKYMLMFLAAHCGLSEDELNAGADRMRAQCDDMPTPLPPADEPTDDVERCQVCGEPLRDGEELLHDGECPPPSPEPAEVPHTA